MILLTLLDLTDPCRVVSLSTLALAHELIFDISTLYVKNNHFYLITQACSNYDYPVAPLVFYCYLAVC